MVILNILVVSTYILLSAAAAAAEIVNLPSRLRSGTKAQRGGVDATGSFQSAVTNNGSSTRVEQKAVAEIEVWERVLAKGWNSYQTSPLFPKDCCGLPYGARQKQLFQIFSTVSNPTDIKTPGTPQYKAFNWIIYDDDYCLCPNNSSCELIQRYVMAVFYYSTGGEKWVNCGAASTVCNPSGSTYNGFATSACFEGASERWLAPVSSCRWCGNVCDDLNHITCITQIDIGENPRVQFKFSLMD